jgi:hypothetical protein
MEIHISVQTTEPLTGSATTEGEGPLYFEGWLELLRVLSTLMAAWEPPNGPRERRSDLAGDGLYERLRET